MELSVQLTCPCRPTFSYKNEISIEAHKKTKLHKTWEAQQDQKKDKVRSKEFENEIERLKRRIIHKEAIEAELLNRIRQLEYELTYLKKVHDGVYVN